MEQGRPGKGSTLYCLDSSQSCSLRTFLRARLRASAALTRFFSPGFQIKGVALDLFDDVFLLHLALEAAQCVLEGFTLLQSNFRQTDTPPNPSGRTE
jgi:hypothetical protein